MQYEGKLYGKVAGKYIELGETSEIDTISDNLNKRIAELEDTLKSVKGWLNKCEAEAFETANPFLMGAIGHALAEISEGGADD